MGGSAFVVVAILAIRYRLSSQGAPVIFFPYLGMAGLKFIDIVVYDVPLLQAALLNPAWACGDVPQLPIEHCQPGGSILNKYLEKAGVLAFRCFSRFPFGDVA